LDRSMLDWSAVGQFSSLSSRTNWQRLPAGACPTAHRSLDMLRLKVRAVFDGSDFNADPHQL